jgi:RNA-directed DNA polymerase
MITSLPELRSQLKVPPEELEAILDRITNHYFFVEVPKTKYGRFQLDEQGNVRTRNLMVPDHTLKSIQRRIAAILNRKEFPSYMYGSIKKRNNIQNAQLHVGHQYFLTIDLKKFFPNISHRQVNRMFVNNGFSHCVARILTQLSTHQYSLPQGAPSSPVIANLVFKQTTDKLQELSRNNRVTFTSFLDDLTFSSNYCFKKLIRQIIEVLKNDDFFPSYEKIHYRKRYCEVTGLFVKKHGLELTYDMQKAAKSNAGLKGYAKSVDKSNSQLPNNPLHLSKISLQKD